MSTELYMACVDDCGERPRCVHVGTRYAGGVKLLTIGPSKERVEAWLTQHSCCDLYIVDEHRVYEAGWAREE